MTGLLDGMRVLDTSMWRPMPHATQILCDLGADVLKIERPGGDPMRVYPELFAALSRGKRSIELDLKAATGKARALELVGECDVFCESWRPGVADRLGLGAEALRTKHRALIYCSISGYGQTGPWRDVPGHDLNYQALGGALTRQLAGGDARPEIPRLPAADLEAGTLAALLVCAAWARRLTDGVGERIDVAMADVMAWWVGPRSSVLFNAPGGASAASGGGEPAPTPNLHNATVNGPDAGASQTGTPGYGVFVTADGGHVTLAPLNEPHLWRAICEALEIPQFSEMSFAERADRIAEIDRAVAGAIAQMPLKAALDRLHRAGAPAAPVLTPEQAATHPQFVAREQLSAVDNVAVPLLPALLDAHPRLAAAPVPTIGAHPSGFRPRPSR